MNVCMIYTIMIYNKKNVILKVTHVCFSVTHINYTFGIVDQQNTHGFGRNGQDEMDMLF